MTAQVLLLAGQPAAWPLLQSEPPLLRLLNALTLLTVVLVAGICLVALQAILVALLPNIGQRSQAALVRSPWRAFFIGLANYLFLGAISLLLFNLKIEALGLVGLVIIGFLGVVTLLGLSGLVMLTGERLARLREREMSPWQRLVWGTIALELASFLPFVGWLLLTPVLLCIAFGAAVLAWRGGMTADR
jgi:hypothetical protein